MLILAFQYSMHVLFWIGVYKLSGEMIYSLLSLEVNQTIHKLRVNTIINNNVKHTHVSVFSGADIPSVFWQTMPLLSSK